MLNLLRMAPSKGMFAMEWSEGVVRRDLLDYLRRQDKEVRLAQLRSVFCRVPEEFSIDGVLQAMESNGEVAFDEKRRKVELTDKGRDRAEEPYQARPTLKEPVAIQGDVPQSRAMVPRELPPVMDLEIEVLRQAHEAAKRAREDYIESCCDRHTLRSMNEAVEKTGALLRRQVQSTSGEN